jgi:hypothetical protein
MRQVFSPARRSLAPLAALCVLAAAVVRADDGDGLISGPFEEPPRLQMRRIDTPPEIDGHLDDDVWRGAPGFRGFTTTEPVPNGTPTEETTIRFLYDSEFLYMAVRAFDREPDRIIAVAQIQDDFMLQDDVVGVFIDTFGEGRSGYSFATNPLGNRYDALIEANRVELEWDGIWYARSRIDELGWTAEIKIPFETLSFDPHGRDWGFNMVREVRRKNEKQRLMYGNPGRKNFDLAALPRLAGMTGMEQGLGLTAKPGLAVRNRRERSRQTSLGQRPGRRRFTAGTPSLDVFYRVTPALTGALTLNTDFSEAPVDTRQLNLTRFAAFFPEQRDFFLEDAGIFDFGGLSKESNLNTRDNPIPLGMTLNGMPFFSRSIGIGPDGENIGIDGGAKLTGRVGHVNVGLLSVRMDSHGVYDPVAPAPESQHAGLDRKQLSVARISLNVLEESRVGLIATHGDPAFNRDASTLGADFNYRSSRIFGDRVLNGNLWVLDTGRDSLPRHDAERGGLVGTDVPPTGTRDAAFGMRLDYPNDLVNWRLTAKEIQENYRPAMGFTDRTDVREYTSVFRHRTRLKPGPDGRRGLVKYFDVGWDSLLVTDVDDHLQTGELGLRLLDVANNQDDKLTMRWIASEERLDDFFNIYPGILIPPGRYQFTRGEISLTSKDVHPLSGRILTSYGEFYSGRRLETDIRLVWRPSRRYQLEADWIQADVRFPSEIGDFTSRLLRGRALLMFSTRVSWDTVVQYDNSSDSVGVNSRLRWELEPGNELFLVFNHGFSAARRPPSECAPSLVTRVRCSDESELRSAASELIGKVEWTFRF